MGLTERDYLELLGKGFQKGARGPHFFDCYGLVKEIYRRLDVVLPEYESPDEHSLIHQMINEGKELFVEIDEPEPYCLVIFRLRPRYVTHMGVVLEDGKRFVHVLKKSRVSIERLDNLFWAEKIAGFLRWKT